MITTPAKASKARPAKPSKAPAKARSAHAAKASKAPAKARSVRPAKASKASPARPSKTGPLEVSFRAPLQKSPKPGGWTYLVWPKSPEFFGTRGLVKVEGLMDGVPFRSSFMALGDGRHKLPVKEEIRARINKNPGDTIRVDLRARLA